MYFPRSAADVGLNGRWNIEVPDQLPPVAWWLEVQGAEGTNPKGWFTGAPGGQTESIKDLEIREGRLRFSFVKPRGGAPPFRATWTAGLRDGSLDGVREIEGKAPVKWIGRRAPVLQDRDDGTWRQGKPVILFNGRDLSGWRPADPRQKMGWVVQDGILTNPGGAANILSEQKFWNFILRATFRVRKGGNSGIGLRGRYEVQIWDDFDRTVDGHSTGAVYGRILPAFKATKPAGEWQTYEIRLVGRHVTVVLNGLKVIDNKEIVGLTAIAVDAHEAEPGRLLIQGDHGSAEFRELVLVPLDRE